ncbi:MAG TPA: GAF domain-containing protein [Bacillota bacterium]
MADALVRFVDRMPDWAVGIGSVLILAALAYALIALGRGAHRWANAMSREELIHDLTQRLYEASARSERFEGLTSLLQSVVERLGQVLYDLRDLRVHAAPQEVVPAMQAMVRRVLEMIPLDVKVRPDDMHRVGLWMELEDGWLTLAVASAGFPAGYLYNRRLHINESIAGRVYRKGREEVVADVSEDPDYAPNPDATHRYTALVLLPIEYNERTAAVLTVDGKAPFTEHQIAVCRAYAAFITYVFSLLADALGTTEPFKGVRDAP